MCIIMDAAEQRGIMKGEMLKLIFLVKKKLGKGYSVSEIADDLYEDVITILPIYNVIKEYPEDTEKEIYQKLNKE